MNIVGPLRSETASEQVAGFQAPALCKQDLRSSGTLPDPSFKSLTARPSNVEPIGCPETSVKKLSIHAAYYPGRTKISQQVTKLHVVTFRHTVLF